ncbi:MULTISPECIES: hypothetical protein [unclassified Streptomyces]|uniref:hypothetical protein n=1 Tax=unclassified Streptomyces TaxID=2593676 RepID=UPI0033EF3113
MPAPYPFGETVRIVRTGLSPGRDERGHPLPGPDISFDLTGCVVTPRQENPGVGSPEQQGRDTVIKGWTVYAPAGSDVRTTDRVVIRGQACEVTGEPGNWGRSPFSGTRGVVQFAADRVTG